MNVTVRGLIEVANSDYWRSCFEEATADNAVDSGEAATAMEACLRRNGATSRVFWTPTLSGATWDLSDDATVAYWDDWNARAESAAREFLERCNQGRTDRP